MSASMLSKLSIRIPAALTTTFSKPLRKSLWYSAAGMDSCGRARMKGCSRKKTLLAWPTGSSTLFDS
eukprot:CAMPEP_0176314988 /NCGR_PEP_ID=MMETSP0121_2-20121125/67966_1 /TAXON_ID=160619 /ORGANISM="Kryptoperidinium foliaceum, Strain CCMP 1326" /LENGTH=66 /DNA_ID=CAMNT_0017657115 /DNA_START=11 /DNA_END=207 /DNA_ORIENTATION=-